MCYVYDGVIKVAHGYMKSTHTYQITERKNRERDNSRCIIAVVCIVIIMRYIHFFEHIKLYKHLPSRYWLVRTDSRVFQPYFNVGSMLFFVIVNFFLFLLDLIDHVPSFVFIKRDGYSFLAISSGGGALFSFIRYYFLYYFPPIFLVHYE